MVKTQRAPLIYSAVSGCCGLITLIVALATDYWISADLTISNSTTISGSINHGLFAGSFQRINVGSTSSYSLYVTCLQDEGVCALSCLGDLGDREDEIKQLLSTGNWKFKCTPSAKEFKIQEGNPIAKIYFLDALFWTATVACLAISLFANLVAISFNIYNVFGNPIEVYATPMGVSIYYGVAATASLLTLIMWGTEYGVYISTNVGLPETLLHQMDSSANLHFSYFMVLISLLGQLGSICVIAYRDYLIKKANAAQVIKVDDRTNDASTFMY